MSSNGNNKITNTLPELNKPNREEFKLFLIDGETEIKGILQDGTVLSFTSISNTSNTGFIEFSNTNGNLLADGMDYFISTGTTMGATINSSTPTLKNLTNKIVSIK